MRTFLILSLSIMILANCGDPAPSRYPTQESHVEDATLGRGDIFEVRVYKHEDMSGVYEITSEGTISFPLIGIVVAGGKTPAEVERDIHDRLADGYLKNPSVSVLVKEAKSKKISVLGEVQKPITMSFVEAMTVIDVIAKAGGFTAMAQKNAVTVTRNINGKKTSYTIPVGDIGDGNAENFYIRPGDVVSIPRRVW